MQLTTKLKNIVQIRVVFVFSTKFEISYWNSKFSSYGNLTFQIRLPRSTKVDGRFVLTEELFPGITTTHEKMSKKKQIIVFLNFGAKIAKLTSKSSQNIPKSKILNLNPDAIIVKGQIEFQNWTNQNFDFQISAPKNVFPKFRCQKCKVHIEIVKNCSKIDLIKGFFF